jgi:hypothetical protein
VQEKAASQRQSSTTVISAFLPSTCSVTEEEKVCHNHWCVRSHCSNNCAVPFHLAFQLLASLIPQTVHPSPTDPE